MISVSDKKWRERKIDINLIEKFSQDNNFSYFLSKILMSRNFDNEEIFTIKNQENLYISNVFKNSKDFEESVNLVIKKINNKEKICIFGDYDVDGSCSVALFAKFFKSINQPDNILFFCCFSHESNTPYFSC